MRTKMKTMHTRLSGKERLALFTDLSTMITAGIPILEAIESLAEDARGNIKKVVKIIHDTVSNGEPLSVAMEHLPHAFDNVTINLVKAAETGGTLEETLEDLVRITKKELAFSSSLKTTMIYPMFVSFVFLGIVIMILTFVMPRVSKVFSSLNVQLPMATIIMFKASAYLLAYWPRVLAGSVAGIILLIMFVTWQKRLIIRLLLGMPGLRGLGRMIDLTRFTRSFALLVRSGVPLDESLDLSARVVHRREVLAVVNRMRSSLEHGESLAAGLRDPKSKKVVPPLMVRSVETAETTGTLEKTMQNLAEYFDEQVQQRLKVVSSMLEPILILVVGIMVGTLMITIMAPMYNLISQINKR